MHHFRYRFVVALGALALAFLADLVRPAQAEGLAKPTGEVLLTVTGHIGKTNGSGVVQLDLGLLENLPQHEFTTSTTWTQGTQTFRGVLLRDLISALGITGSTMNLTALNDYRISMPVADVYDDGPLLAYMMDGKTMSVREKGPVWMVYPYDSNAAYRTEQTYARSIWQLVQIEFAD
jgi:hypothetical protein